MNTTTSITPIIIQLFFIVILVDLRVKISNSLLLLGQMQFRSSIQPFLVFIISLYALSAVGDIVQVPELKARVNDFTSTFSAMDVQHLESKVASFEQSKGSQIVVLIIPTTGDETIEQYGIKVAE